MKRLGPILAILPTLLAGGCALPRTAVDRVEKPPVPVIGSEPGKQAPTELVPKQAARVCLEMAHTLEEKGQEADAAAYYEEARRQDPTLPVARSLAVLYDTIGDDRKARDEYAQALAATPNDANLHNDFGYFHYNRGDWAAAESSYRQALAIDPKNSTAWNNLGMALGEQGRDDESLAAFARAVGPAQAHCNLAFILLTRGRRDEAAGHYRAALAMEPGLATARTALDRMAQGPSRPAAGPSKDRKVAAGEPGIGKGR